MMVWNMIKSRLGEASTWKGILSVATGLGLELSGAQVDLIAAAMVAVYAALSALLPDTFADKRNDHH